MKTSIKFIIPLFLTTTFSFSAETLTSPMSSPNDRMSVVEELIKTANTQAIPEEVKGQIRDIAGNENSHNWDERIRAAKIVDSLDSGGASHQALNHVYNSILTSPMSSLNDRMSVVEELIKTANTQAIPEEVKAQIRDFAGNENSHNWDERIRAAKIVDSLDSGGASQQALNRVYNSILTSPMSSLNDRMSVVEELIKTANTQAIPEEVKAQIRDFANNKNNHNWDERIRAAKIVDSLNGGGASHQTEDLVRNEMESSNMGK